MTEYDVLYHVTDSYGQGVVFSSPAALAEYLAREKDAGVHLITETKNNEIERLQSLVDAECNDYRLKIYANNTNRIEAHIDFDNRSGYSAFKVMHEQGYHVVEVIDGNRVIFWKA